MNKIQTIQAITKDLNAGVDLFWKGRHADGAVTIAVAIDRLKDLQLMTIYESEFVEIDGRQQHRDGLTFEEWRREKGIE